MPGGPHPPLDVIVTWTPNYVDPVKRGIAFIVAIPCILAVTYVVVGLRLFARSVLRKNTGLDDILTVINLIPLTGLAAALCLAYRKYGFDRHVWDNPPSVLVHARKITLALEVLYMVSTTITKVSILLFYRRLAAGSVTNRFKYCVYAAIAFVMTYFTIFFISLFVSCRPFYAEWMLADWVWDYKHRATYKCIDEGASLVSSAVISVLQDFITLGMPMALFWKVSLPKSQKVALRFIFGIGILVCIAGTLRIVFAVRVYYFTYDMTWESYGAWISLTVEANVAIICASAPALKIYFKNIFKSTMMPRGFWKKRNGSNDPEISAVESAHAAPTQDNFAGKGAWLITTDSDADATRYESGVRTTIYSDGSMGPSKRHMT